ncbi:MAG: MBL fold metallo-hydrolase [Candidatus Eremiobacterota bacterium]
MKIIIHGGANQIGGNCVEVISENTRLIVDTGIPITNIDGTPFDSSMFNNLSGKELLSKSLIPDIKGLYFWDEPVVSAVLLSHYHQDHYGWIKYVHPGIPCYLGEISHRMIESRSIINNDPEPVIKNYCYFKSWEAFSTGNIKITPFLMDHSACDSYAFTVECENKRIVYTGDFRNHGRKGKLFRSFLEQCPLPLDFLIIEGTTFSNEEHERVTEEEVEEKLVKICNESSGLILGFTSTQNIDRIVSFYKSAIKTGRTMVIDPYQAYVLDQVGWNVPGVNDSYKIKVMYSHFISKKIAETGHIDILYRYKSHKISREELHLNPGKYVLLIRGSMMKDLQIIGNLSSATLIYSLWHGYKSEKKTQEFLSELMKNGVTITDLHSSGHADFDTIKQMVDKLQPKNIIPIHTENGDKFKEISNNIIEPYNGMVLDI